MPAASLGPSSKRRTAILSDGSITTSSSVSKLTSPSLVERLKYSAGLTHDPDRDLARGVRGDSQDEPLGSVGYENVTNEKGERYVRLAPNVVDCLRHLRGPGESYSDVILRLADR
jgi:hypothetical protein